MKYLSLFLLAALILSCSTTKKISIKPGPPIVTFEQPIYDFGDLVKGEKRTHIFKFKNTGTEPLIIEIATGCSCTSIDYPTLPIASGASGEIKIVFDSGQKKMGPVDVDIDVIANTKPIVTTAQFLANVIAP